MAVKYDVHVKNDMYIKDKVCFVGFIISLSRYLNTAKNQNIANFKFFHVKKNPFCFFIFFKKSSKLFVTKQTCEQVNQTGLKYFS